MEEQINKSKRLVYYTLAGIYMNLIFVFCTWTFPLWGNDDFVWIILVSLSFISWVLIIIFTVMNIKNAFWLYVNGKFNNLKKYMTLQKLVAIPYFILNFIFCLLIAIAALGGSRGLIVFTPIPILFLIPIFFTFVTVVCTSIYGIFFIGALLKENRIEFGKALIHIIFQICFVLDVVDTIVLIINYRVKKNINETIKEST